MEKQLLRKKEPVDSVSYYLSFKHAAVDDSRVAERAQPTSGRYPGLALGISRAQHHPGAAAFHRAVPVKAELCVPAESLTDTVALLTLPAGSDVRGWNRTATEQFAPGAKLV
jgi:hypothetical protein